MPLKFVTGLMSSGKSARLIEMAWKHPKESLLVLTTRNNSRRKLLSPSGKQVPCAAVQSRNGLVAEDVKVWTGGRLGTKHIYYATCILVDEAHWLTKEQIDELVRISKNRQVVCFGLRMDMNGVVWPAAIELFRVADEVEVLRPPLCKFAQQCGLDAKFDVVDGDGSNPQDASYVQLCDFHKSVFGEPDLRPVGCPNKGEPDNVVCMSGCKAGCLSDIPSSVLDYVAFNNGCLADANFDLAQLE